MGAAKRMFAYVDLLLLGQRGHLFQWVPVFLAIGIGSYFALPEEPDQAVYLGLIGLAAGCSAAALRWPGGWSALGWAIAMVAAGICLAGWQAHRVAAPVLGWRYYGPIEGRVVALDRSASDAVRVTLDRVVLNDVARYKTPGRVRVSLHGPAADLSPGQRILTVGHLSPPQGPVEPGGFDFQRHAWFQGLGAVGYTRKRVLTIDPPAKGLAGLRIFDLRIAMSRRVQEVLPGDIGGFSAAISTGDRSAIGQGALAALRASNLAHLLAISGLHMGLLAGFVFMVLRVALSLVPALALRLPVKKIAAAGALVAAAGYLGLSGGNVATERAFIMVAVVLCAVLVDRRAFSMRAVAVAALIVLCLRPDALMGPGFQMSFAATTALIAVFGGLRDARIWRAPAWLQPVTGVALSSAVAGLATAPVGAAHFNTIAQYGLLANLTSVPLMGVLVIPAGVLALCLAPLGLEWIGLWLMGLGLRWILGVAHWVADIDGAQRFVVSPPDMVLPVLALGGLWLVLWQGRARWAGLVPIVTAFALWSQAERPQVLIADTGGLVGVMTDQGRALSKPKGAGFIASNWLENDGDASDQAEAAARWPTEPDAIDRLRDFDLGPVQLRHVFGKRAAATLTTCTADQLVVSSVPLKLTGGCEVYDPKRLRHTGSLAITDGQIVTASSITGDRLWNARSRHQTRRYARRGP